VARDDIIRMAREAGFNEIQTNAMVFGAILERFAALVAAAEREAILKDGWRQCAKDQRTTQFCGMVEQAVLAEREACAKVCEEPGWNAANWCATQIRARGQA
jgi:hypothetical protein